MRDDRKPIMVNSPHSDKPVNVEPFLWLLNFIDSKQGRKTIDKAIKYLILYGDNEFPIDLINDPYSELYLIKDMFEEIEDLAAEQAKQSQANPSQPLNKNTSELDSLLATIESQARVINSYVNKSLSN